MKAIKKQGEPAALKDWKRDMQHGAPQNLDYGNLPTPVKDAIKSALLVEQGYLCAYTLQRLAAASDCHIEHVEPQNAAPGKSLDYANMAACWPDNGGNVTSGYGAPVKAGAAVTLNVDFVSPHAPGCEARFVYDASGAVRPRGGDAAVQGTIDRVQLCHDRLCELRRSTAQAWGLVLSPRGMRSSRRHLKSAAEARRFAAEVLQPDALGRLEPFCVALSQIALKYAEQEEKRSQRLRSGHGGKAGE